MANPAVGNMTGMAGYTNQDLLKQADRAGKLSLLNLSGISVCVIWHPCYHDVIVCMSLS